MNFQNTFIQIADTCPLRYGIAPNLRYHFKTIAHYQYQMLAENPYFFNAEELLFSSYAIHRGIDPVFWKGHRLSYIIKEQPCLRSSPLCQTYGWGLHCNENGKIALYGAQTEDYALYASNTSLLQLKAFKSVALLYGKTN